MNLDDIDLKEIFPEWFWMLGIGLAIGCAVLIALYYQKYPERNWFDDFRRSIPQDLSGLDVPASKEDVPPGEG